MAWGRLGSSRVAPLPRKSILGPMASITFRIWVRFACGSPVGSEAVGGRRDGWGSGNQAERERGALEGMAVKSIPIIVNNPSGLFGMHSAAGFDCRRGSANLIKSRGIEMFLCAFSFSMV